MNAINLQKSNSCDFTRMAAYSKSDSACSQNGVPFVQHLNVSEKDITESTIPDTFEVIRKTDYDDKNDLFNQNEMENILFSNRIVPSSSDITCSKTALTDDQDSALGIMRILGVKLRNEVNWESDGTGQLTTLQIEDLKSRYNIWNLDINEYCNLLVELVNLNVLSSDDLVKQFVHELPPEVLRDGGLVYSSSLPLVPEQDSIWNRILLKNESFDELLRAIDSRNTSFHESNVNSVRRFYEKEKESSQRLVDTFELLKR